jgi:hypothetical protein
MILSSIMPSRVEYSPDGPAEAPTRLLLKSSRDGLEAGLQSLVGEHEVAFYTQAAPFAPIESTQRTRKCSGFEELSRVL